MEGDEEMKRSTSIELYRVMLMFGIVLLHTAGTGDVRAPWLSNLLKFCVTGFVFISGYFGIKFSWRKLGELYALAATCAILGAFMQWVWRGDANLAVNWLQYMKWFWFLHAYAILMMFAPILNLAINHGGGYKLTVMPIVILVFGWSYLYEIGHLKPFVFPASGLGAHTPLTLIGIYLLARLFRVHDLDVKMPTKCVLAAIVLSMLFAVIGLVPYNSPFAFCIAAGLFILFKRFVKCGEWVLFVAPSMFAVYLLHVTQPGIAFIREAGNYIVAQGMSKYIMFIIVAIVLFVACLAIDLVRRFIMFNLRKVCNG